MKGVLLHDMFRGIAHKNHAYSFSYHSLVHFIQEYNDFLRMLFYPFSIQVHTIGNYLALPAYFLLQSCPTFAFSLLATLCP